MAREQRTEYEGFAIFHNEDDDTWSLHYRNAYSSRLLYEVYTDAQLSILRELITRWEQDQAAGSGDFPPYREQER